MKTKQRETAAEARTSPAGDNANIHLDRPIYTLSVASEILDTHPRTLMMYEHLNMIKPKRTVTNRRRYSQRDLMKLQAIQTLTRKHGVNLAGVRSLGGCRRADAPDTGRPDPNPASQGEAGLTAGAMAPPLRGGLGNEAA